jgi:hypothetical protein
MINILIFFLIMIAKKYHIVYLLLILKEFKSFIPATDEA